MNILPPSCTWEQAKWALERRYPPVEMVPITPENTEEIRERLRAAMRAEFDRSSMDYELLLRHRRRLYRAKRRRARKMARRRRRGW